MTRGLHEPEETSVLRTGHAGVDGGPARFDSELAYTRDIFLLDGKVQHQMPIIKLVPSVPPEELRFECPECTGHLFELFADHTVNCTECGFVLDDLSVWEVPPTEDE